MAKSSSAEIKRPYLVAAAAMRDPKRKEFLGAVATRTELGPVQGAKDVVQNDAEDSPEGGSFLRIIGMPGASGEEQEIRKSGYVRLPASHATAFASGCCLTACKSESRESIADLLVHSSYWVRFSWLKSRFQLVPRLSLSSLRVTYDARRLKSNIPMHPTLESAFLPRPALTLSGDRMEES
ncbi:hypothetical protein M413DRAFT_136716 [Hebeloma cylindrosporum]|uniref:Uncharacterized protein n=1 Tax=Hebeloma cylindrosporum TaxID=76867 RepID=A0A0C3CBV6_HEBCY|nr:hypothetical protein M413DRAFT_136716 [Hebeloma cylindrosporum h7]